MTGASALAADAPPAGITVAVNPVTHSVLVTGPGHGKDPFLSLNRTDWWLEGEIKQGEAGDPRLVFTADMPHWALLASATDAHGAKLDTTVLHRGVSPRNRHAVIERIAVTLPRGLADKARATGLSLTITGKNRSFEVEVPGAALTAFLASYDAEAVKRKQELAAQPAPPPTPPALEPSTKTAAAPAPPAPEPSAKPASSAATPAPAAASAESETPSPEAPSTAASDQGGADLVPVPSLGLQFAATPFGAMILNIEDGSAADRLGLGIGDMIEAVDGHSIKGLSGAAMAAKIGSPKAKVLTLTAAGDVTIR